MSFFMRTIAWLLAAAVTFATLGPPGLRPHSDLGQDGEHALAFILVGLAFGLAYGRRRLLIAGAAVVLIGVLELMQFWAPGRHARLEDFLVDAATACLGFALAAAADWLLTRFRTSTALTSEGPAE
ncbi:VanZ family protein [Bradyrhizobium sp. CCBAU 25338]|jgi:VanZ family protein|uniref:VanZ family protein n=1 Tax=Bradyrhizobium sp. CCBAU 25338 TaxID=1641877 RepID=UPI002302678E|nr:VanZ family protein [Bradyrhizobium sp. CCBAU 25338]MDA9527135.1 antibiotic resistance protein VanZ [Bradyrhizobium sp. CCBAU 25338]